MCSRYYLTEGFFSDLAHTLQELDAKMNRPANVSMSKVHDRMPLILEPAMFTGWLTDTSVAESIRNMVPAELKKHSEMEQMRLEL